MGWGNFCVIPTNYPECRDFLRLRIVVCVCGGFLRQAPNMIRQDLPGGVLTNQLPEEVF